MLTGSIVFPNYSGTRCLMMPFIQGDPSSVPDEYREYEQIIATTFVRQGDIGYLTIDESSAVKGEPHRGERAKFGRALHTEAGKLPHHDVFVWGVGWGKSHQVTLDPEVAILLANNVTNSCALWDAVHADTSIDGDIGDAAQDYPYEDATFMKAGDVHRIGVLTPHESIPVAEDVDRQFLRIVGSGVHGREPYFTENPLLSAGSF